MRQEQSAAEMPEPNHTSRPVGPFAGLKVLDLTHALSGPFATQLLADLGADVVKLENPGHQDFTRTVPPLAGHQSHYFMAINHGKRSIAADLRSDEGKALALALAAKADILIENFRPGAIQRMGLGYEAVASVNSRIIHCSISGFGQDGEAASRPAYDIVIQAMSGFMSVTGEREGSPLRSGVSIGDMVAGLYAVQAISAALYERERTGKGAALDVSMFDCLASMLSYYVTLAQVSGRAPQPTGSDHATIVPLGSFRTSDGWIVVAATTDVFWCNLARAIGREELGTDPKYVTLADRQQRRDEISSILSDAFSTATSADWAKTLDSFDVPNGPVLDVLGLLASPLAAERRLFRPVSCSAGDINVTRYPVIDRSVGIPSLPANSVPELGEHGEEIKRDWLGVWPVSGSPVLRAQA
jgi:crotonobetainyl-CoA:carnitine CoA-transferase CaiB-like acyl-CoA transferase